MNFHVKETNYRLLIVISGDESIVTVITLSVSSIRLSIILRISTVGLFIISRCIAVSDVWLFTISIDQISSALNVISTRLYVFNVFISILTVICISLIITIASLIVPVTIRLRLTVVIIAIL